jgi:hypothetical protein
MLSAATKKLTNQQRWIALLALSRICRMRTDEDLGKYYTEMPVAEKVVDHYKYKDGVYACSKIVDETDSESLFALVQAGSWFFNTPINGGALIYKDRGESIRIIDHFHLIDPADMSKNTGHVFSLRMLSSHIREDRNFRQYETPHARADVVLSSSFEFLIDNLQQGVDLESAMLNADDMAHGYPVSLEIIKNGTGLFSIDLELATSTPEARHDKYRVNLDEIKVINATLEEIKQMGRILSPNQQRRLRGQLLEDGLGL